VVQCLFLGIKDLLDRLLLSVDCLLFSLTFGFDRLVLSIDRLLFSLALDVEGLLFQRRLLRFLRWERQLICASVNLGLLFGCVFLDAGDVARDVGDDDDDGETHRGQVEQGNHASTIPQTPSFDTQR
jgi:hypothetical protein